MPRTVTAPLEAAEDILLLKGRTFTYRGKYLQIQVFTKYLTEVSHLEKRWGGHHYKHGTGFVWLIAKREMLLKIVDDLRDGFPSENGFEVPIIQNYL